jgi:predicted TIM-barrel fold metal-dependent hydrolase
MHVFGPVEKYPPAPARAYTPRPATLAEYRALTRPLGLERVVLVQPSAYGTDNACMLDALRAGDPTLRGVAVIDDATPDTELASMHALGVCGVRLNLVSSGVPDPEAARARLQATATRIAHLGWHVQIYANPALLTELLPILMESPVPVVIDHMGGVNAALGGGQPMVKTLASLIKAGRVWIKLSGANRISDQHETFSDAIPVMAALVGANPDRLVWGSDWPHIGPHSPGAKDAVTFMPHDNAALLALLIEACGNDRALLTAILADNPARLYRFAS